MIIDTLRAVLAGMPLLLLEGARDLLIPEACFLCGAPLLGDGRPLSRYLCPACLETVRLVRDPVCPRCGERIRASSGASWPQDRAGRCGRCLGRSLGFDRCAAGALYGGAVKELVLRLKFSRDLRAALPLGRLARLGAERALAERKSALAERTSALGECDRGGLRPVAVTAVPLHPLKRIRRGYNQAGLIARVVARELNVPCIGGLVRRVRYTPSQGAGGGRDRRINMRGAFVPSRRLRRLAAAGRLGRAEGPGPLLLVDDVVSTTATMDQCARALREGGVESVIGAAAAT